MGVFGGGGVRNVTSSNDIEQGLERPRRRCGWGGMFGGGGQGWGVGVGGMQGSMAAQGKAACPRHAVPHQRHISVPAGAWVGAVGVDAGGACSQLDGPDAWVMWVLGD